MMMKRHKPKPFRKAFAQTLKEGDWRLAITLESIFGQMEHS